MDHVKQVKVTLAGKETKANLVNFGFDWSNNDNPLQLPLTLVPRAPTTFFVVSYDSSMFCLVPSFAFRSLLLTIATCSVKWIYFIDIDKSSFIIVELIAS